MERKTTDEIEAKIRIKPLETSDFIDLKVCCEDMVELFPDLETDINQGRIQGIIALYDGVCAGAIIATLDLGSLDPKIQPFPLPCLRILFLEVNLIYRGKGIGSFLLQEFIKQQRKNNVECIFIELYKNFRSGCKFFEKFGFQKTNLNRNRILLKLDLWSDFGVVNDDTIDVDDIDDGN
ncbi:MAG: GNAT family N-acetyltransferase [Promethearchaeota archaeon]